MERRQNGQPDPNDPAQKLLGFLKDPFAQQVSSTSVPIAFGYSIGFMVLITIFFSFIRPRHSIVYAPKMKTADKKHAPPPVGKGLFSWVSPLYRTGETTIVEKVGLDAAIFLRFTRMLRNMFLVLTVIGCGILIPVHWLLSNKDLIPDKGRPFITALTPLLVQGQPMWSHVVVAYLFTFTVLFFLWMNWRAVVKLRKNYFESPAYQNSLHSRTIWMVDIPQASRSDEGILKIADSVESTASIPHPAIARNVKELPDLIEEHEETVKTLESILAKYLKNPDRLPVNRPTIRPSKKDHRANHRDGNVDAIDYLANRIKALEIEIKDTRESIDKRNPLSYGFAIYDRIEEAHTVAYAARKKKPAGVTIRLAPKPHDFIWQNLALSKGVRRRKRFFINMWVAVLTFIWIAPNALIAIFLVNLSHLGALWPAFQRELSGNTTLWAAVQAIVGPGLLSLVYIVLPIIFRRLSIRAGDQTKTSRERHVTHKLFAFFVFNNLIVFSIFSAVWSFVAAVIDQSGSGTDVWTAIKQADLPNSIMTTLCSVSTFWLTWILQRNIGAAADLGQLLQLFWTWFARTFMSPTPRQYITWTAPQPFDYAVYYNYYLFTITVALATASLQPLVLPVTCLYVGIEIWLKKYLLLYVFITKTESGGLFWNLLCNRILVAMFLSQCIEALVIKGAQGTYTMLFCMVPLPFLLIAFKWYTMRAFEDQSKYYIKAALTDPEHMVTAGKTTKQNTRIGMKFGHPALYKPLIAPMVHARSKHLLGQIYRGRIDGDDGDAFGFGDVAMNPMSQGQPGKAQANAARDMFEVVSEHELDFAYFKNRADFGDEHGGGGELYGRPMDLVSERSGTPKSFMTEDERYSNAGTPPPMPMGTGLRQQRPDELANHPAFRTQSPGPGGLYQQRNDSGRSLLGGAQPTGYTPLSRDQTPAHEISEQEMYGMERWRTGGEGYGGPYGGNSGDLGYESYRTQGGPAGYGPGRGHNPAQGYEGYHNQGNYR